MNDSLFKHCIKILNDDDIQVEIKKMVYPLIELLTANFLPYLYLAIFILMFLFLCTLVILGLLVQILRKNIVRI